MDSYKTSFRRNLVDMHIEDWDAEFLSKFSAEDYFDNLVRAKISTAMIYIHSHVGYCFFPTKTGKMHNAFAGREDEMRKLFDMCHAAGINVIAYFSVTYDNYAYGLDESFRVKDINGNASRAYGNRYGLNCPNSPGYREYVKKLIMEFCAYFDFEGVYFDMTFWSCVCYCDNCKARYLRETGKQLPVIIDWKDPDWVQFQQSRTDWMEDFAEYCNGILFANKKGVSVTHQYSPAMSFFQYGQSENMAKASTYCGGDFYGGIEQHSFACKLYYGLTANQPFEFQTSRCYPNLYDHTTTKSRDMLCQCAAHTLAHHGAVFFIDAIDPSGTINKKIYDQIGGIFGWLQPYEKYMRGQLAADVGVYFNLRGKYDPYRAPVAPGTPDNGLYPHLTASLGASRALRNAHVPFAVVNSYRLEQFDKCKIIAMCDAVNVSAAECEKIKEYVRNGGNLYMSGETAPELFTEFFKAEYDGRTEDIVTYMSPEIKGIMPEHSKQAPLAISQPQVKIKGKFKGQKLASMILPYTVPKNGPIFCGDDKPLAENELYKFSSIHSNPPSTKISGASILKTGYGKGNVIWSAAPVEGAERFVHEEVFVNLLKLFGVEFIFKADSDRNIEFILFDDGNKQLLSAVNLSDSPYPAPVKGGKIKIKCLQNPAAVRLLPERKLIKHTYKNGYAAFNIGELKILKMFEIEQ